MKTEPKREENRFVNRCVFTMGLVQGAKRSEDDQQRLLPVDIDSLFHADKINIHKFVNKVVVL